MNVLEQLAELIFPDVTETVADLEKRYPERNLPEEAIVARFAPSPTGFLHTGSLFTSLIGYRFAKQTGGVFYFRLEDTDTKREVKGSDLDLINQLAAFGVVFDEGFCGEGNPEIGNYGPYRQSDREMIYRTVIKEMVKKNLAYPCFCTSDELSELRQYQEANKLNPGYYAEHAKCSHLTPEEAIAKIQAGEKYVMRFRSSGCYTNRVKVHDEIRGDLEFAENDQHIVILKSDGLPTYHFAHLCDDHFMHSTHITRGEEWLASLPTHLELFKSMGWKHPKYAHLPVIMKLDNGNKRKLSKRKDAEAATSYFLQEGYPVEGFLEYLITIANSNFEEWRLQNMNANIFDFNLTFDKMTLDGALFDLAKVKNICKERLARLTKDEFAQRALAYAEEYDQDLFNLINRDVDYFKSIINIERERENPRKDYETFSQVYPLIKFFYEDLYLELLNEQELPFNENISKEDIINVLNTYKANMGLELTEEEWFNNLKEVTVKCGFCDNMKVYKKNKEAYKGSIADVSEILRVTVSTRKNTPNPYWVLQILGKDIVEARIEKVIAKLEK